MRVYVEVQKDRELQYRLLNPHYTDSRFRNSQTIFLAPGHKVELRHGIEMVEDASYTYSDRLRSWYGEKCDKAWEAAVEKGHAKNSAALLEAYLQELMEDQGLRLVHIVAGVNHSNGYPYRVYGFVHGE